MPAPTTTSWPCSSSTASSTCSAWTTTTTTRPRRWSSGNASCWPSSTGARRWRGAPRQAGGQPARAGRHDRSENARPPFRPHLGAAPARPVDRRTIGDRTDVIAAETTRGLQTTDIWLLVVVFVFIVHLGLPRPVRDRPDQDEPGQGRSPSRSRAGGARRPAQLIEHPSGPSTRSSFSCCCATCAPPPSSGWWPPTSSGPSAWSWPPPSRWSFIFVFAEAAPKTWAVQHTERAALLAAPVVIALRQDSRPCGG